MKTEYIGFRCTTCNGVRPNPKAVQPANGLINIIKAYQHSRCDACRRKYCGKENDGQICDLLPGHKGRCVE